MSPCFKVSPQQIRKVFKDSVQYQVEEANKICHVRVNS